MTAGEAPDAAIDAAGGWIGHFPASEPELAPVVESEAHRKAAAALIDTDYAGWVSIEMRATASGHLEAV